MARKDPKDMTEKGKISSKLFKGKPKADNSESYYQKYQRATSWRIMPFSKATINKMIEDLLNYVANPKIVKIRPFFLEKGLREQLVADLAKKHPEFHDAYETAKQIIGERREDLAVYKKYNTNPQAIIPTLRHYSPDWRKTQDETEKHEEKIGQKVVIIEQFSNDETNTDENNLQKKASSSKTPEEVAKKAYRMGMHSNKKQLHIK